MSRTVDETVSKLAGLGGLVEARFKGLKGVFARLAQQHHEVAVLLSRAVGVTSPEQRQSIWRELKQQLIAHEQAELLEIYPVLEGHEATRELSRRHAASAAELDAAVSEVEAIGVQSEAWPAAVDRLQLKLKRHTEDEESEIFPRAQQALGDEASRSLERPFLDAKRTAESKLGG